MTPPYPPDFTPADEMPLPAPPGAVGDLVELLHECPARDCYVVPRECTHVAAQQWCPEPPSHKRSLRVMTVEPLATGGCVVELTRCTGVPLHVELDPDGLPVST